MFVLCPFFIFSHAAASTSFVVSSLPMNHDVSVSSSLFSCIVPLDLRLRPTTPMARYLTYAFLRSLGRVPTISSVFANTLPFVRIYCLEYSCFSCSHSVHWSPLFLYRRFLVREKNHSACWIATPCHRL